MIQRKHAWPMAASLLLAMAPATATATLAASPNGAAARATVTLTQAEQIAVHTFNIPSYYKITQESYDSGGQGNPVSYGLTYGFTTPTQQQQFINVTVDATTGAILNYNRSSLQNTFVYPLPVSESQAKAKAIAWVKKLYPNLYSQVQIQPLSPQMGPLTQAVQYNFNFVRMVGGVQAPFNGIAVTIDQNGHLTSVNETWSTVKFPSAHPALSLTQANTAYADGLPLELSYQNNWQASSGPALVLAYSLPMAPYPQFWVGGQFINQGNGVGVPVIDAQTGKVIDANGVAHPLTPAKQPAPLVPGGPQAPFLTHKVNWTQAQSLAYATRVEHIPAGFSLTSQIQNRTLPNGDVNWSFTWTDKAKTSQYNAQVDATYGFLQNSYMGNGPYTGKARYSQAHMTAVVKQFLERLFPQDTGAISVTAFAFKKLPASVVQSYSLQFLINGLPDGANAGNISANAITGQVSNFYSPLQQGETGPFPSPSKAISLTAAKRAWLQAEPLQLMYLQTNPPQNNTPGQPPGQKPKQYPPAHVVLVYAPVGQYANGGMVDALTGKMLGGLTPSVYTGVIRDIGNSSAAPEIRLLVNHGLLTVSAAGDVHPNRVMTRSQFIQLVTGALNIGQGGPQPLIYSSSKIQGSMADVSSRSPAFSAILSAYESGILPAGPLFQPNRPASRGFAADVLARALGYGAILAHPQAFRLPAKDAASIPQSEYAAAAICYSLGLLSLINGNFDASSGLTVAQAAVSVVYGVDALAQGQHQLMQPGMGY